MKLFFYSLLSYSVPKTGDESNLLLWGIIGGVAIVIIAVLIILLRRNRKSK